MITLSFIELTSICRVFELRRPGAHREDGCTALHFAACAGAGSKVRVLLRAGADALLRDDEGKTALQHAEEGGKQQAADALRNFSIDAPPAGPPESLPPAGPPPKRCRKDSD